MIAKIILVVFIGGLARRGEKGAMPGRQLQADDFTRARATAADGGSGDRLYTFKEGVPSIHERTLPS